MTNFANETVSGTTTILGGSSNSFEASNILSSGGCSQTAYLLIKGGEVRKFDFASTEGWCTVTSSRYVKNGKWSHDVQNVVLATGVQALSLFASLSARDLWADVSLESALESLQKALPGATLQHLLQIGRLHYPVRFQELLGRAAAAAERQADLTILVSRNWDFERALGDTAEGLVTKSIGALMRQANPELEGVEIGTVVVQKREAFEGRGCVETVRIYLIDFGGAPVTADLSIFAQFGNEGEQAAVASKMEAYTSVTLEEAATLIENGEAAFGPYDFNKVQDKSVPALELDVPEKMGVQEIEVLRDGKLLVMRNATDTGIFLVSFGDKKMRDSAVAGEGISVPGRYGAASWIHLMAEKDGVWYQTHKEAGTQDMSLCQLRGGTLEWVHNPLSWIADGLIDL